jgi:uncharacterized protein
MKFTLEPASGTHLIRGYSADEIRIGEQSVRSSCIVTADRLITDWEPQSFAELDVRGVALEAMHLGAACRTFNVLVQEERRVAAALFLR